MAGPTGLTTEDEHIGRFLTCCLDNRSPMCGAHCQRMEEGDRCRLRERVRALVRSMGDLSELRLCGMTAAEVSELELFALSYGWQRPTP